MGETRITATTPLGPDALMFARMSGREAVSTCFRFDTVLASMDMDIASADLLGQPVTLTISNGDNTRYFNGLVDGFALADGGADRAEYSLVLRPWLWFLSKTSDNRIFQNLSVVEIVEEVFGAYGLAKFQKRLQGTYPPLEYCVQYGETDLVFVQRLLEHEGIFYFFEHEDGAHTLVLTDEMAQLAAVPGYDSIKYRADSGAGEDGEETISVWSRRATVVSQSYTHSDYDFEKPAADLLVRSEDPGGYALDDGKRYAYPGTYIELARGDALSGVRLDEVQSVAERAMARASTLGPCPGAVFSLEGYPREAENVSYMVLSAEYDLVDDQYRGGGGSGGDGFAVAYELFPSDTQFRPARATPRPVMKGPQTATVVGPAGEEIFTDQYSRVKVQFHWDRLGQRDENSTCFIRVSAAWAGSGWGFIQIPRIGQEVIVDFLEGDPDQPLITGRVYNASQMPPYELPGNMTQSGWKSNSTPGGGGWNELRFEDKKGAEEVYFQAEKDHNELVKNNESRTIGNDFLEDVGNDATQNVTNDRTETVGNNKSTSVGVDRTVSIGNNDTESVGVDRSLSVGANEMISVGSNSTETIGANHEQSVGSSQTLSVATARTRTVGAAEAVTVGAAQAVTVGAAQAIQVGALRSVSVGAAQTHQILADDAWTIGAGQTVSVGASQSFTIGADQSMAVTGAQSFTVGKDATQVITGAMSIDVGKALSIVAADQITLVCGSASISMKKDGTIVLDGKDITVTGSGKINVKATSDITMKGSKINQN